MLYIEYKDVCWCGNIVKKIVMLFITYPKIIAQKHI